MMGSSDEACTLAQELAGKIVPLSTVGIGGQGVQAYVEEFLQENIIVFKDLMGLDRFMFSLKH
jgi:hypothetical protein